MKVDEAPEKIYINSNIENRIWLIGKGDSSFIEYFRADAFVEKAVNWLRCHPSSHYDDLEEFANAFKKAMKGE